MTLRQVSDFLRKHTCQPFKNIILMLPKNHNCRIVGKFHLAHEKLIIVITEHLVSGKQA